MSWNRDWRLAAAAALVLLVPTRLPAQATADEDGGTQTIEVYASAPLGPAHGDARRATGNMQSLDTEAMTRPGTQALGDVLQELGSVFGSDATGNPFQPDLFYRGYSISPLLGLPQGMAVYQDGVRVNEPFGDTVSLDLVPLVALARADLIPGSNPVFGRNTLAGALALTTKTGFDAPGLGLSLSGGEFGQRAASAEYGVASERFALYLAGEAFEDAGWRDFSRSRATRLFARGTWIPDGDTQFDLSFSGADHHLRGNGAAPIELLKEEGRDAVFTHPDETRPRLAFFNLSGNHRLDDGMELSGSAYFRRNRTHGFNGDGSEFESCERPENAGLLCEEGTEGQEEVVEDLDGEAVVADGTNDSATQNRSRTRQDGYGVSVQIARRLGEAHRIAAGLSLDFSDIEFGSDTELARLTAERGTRGSGVLVADSVVDVHARNDSLGAYVTDTWRATERLELSAAARWNHTRVELDDQIPDGDLSGRHRFSRLNPMVGASYALNRYWTAFGSMAQSTRAPTPVELTCANPDDPCRLPNGFVDDPPLDEVITRTAEMGLRHRGARLSASLALFHAVSDDDILFITDGNLANTGYFDNVGTTLRQGLELGFDAELGLGWRASLQYTGLVAEFRENFLVNSPNHPRRDPLDADAPDPSTRSVRKGDRVPLIPEHLGRAVLGWSDRRVEIDVEAVGRSSSRYRGDEANVDREKIDGFVVVNLSGTWKLLPQLSLFAALENAFDRSFETFGVYGESDEVLGEDFEDARRFVGAGAPRTFEMGLRLRF